MDKGKKDVLIRMPMDLYNYLEKIKKTQRYSYTEQVCELIRKQKEKTEKSK